MEIFLDENLKKIFTIEKLRYYRNLMGALNKSSFVPSKIWISPIKLGVELNKNACHLLTESHNKSFAFWQEPVKSTAGPGPGQVSPCQFINSSKSNILNFEKSLSTSNTAKPEYIIGFRPHRKIFMAVRLSALQSVSASPGFLLDLFSFCPVLGCKISLDNKT